MDWLKAEWDQVLALLITIGAALLAVYRRFTGIELKLKTLEKSFDDHIDEDIRRENRMLSHINEMNKVLISIAEHDVVLREMRTDVRDLRDDIKRLLERR